MSVLEIEEFSSFENIVKFLSSVNMPKFIAKYSNKEPKYAEMAGEIGGTFITFQDIPLEIGIKRDTKISIFIDFRVETKNDLTVLKFIDRDTKIDDVLMYLGTPDFSRDRLDDDTNKMVKYFIGKYSIAIDYDENKILLVSVFEDKYR
jgi:hypothetical protein